MTFAVTALGAFPPPTDHGFPTFLQFQKDGVNLGEATITIVNLADNLTATRGTGPNANVLTISAAAGGGSTDTVIEELTDDIVLGVEDDGKIFWSTIAVEVEVGDLATMPACTFVCPDAGSVTLHPTGAVALDGAQADVVANLATHPDGIVLLPRYGGTNAYSTTQPLATFAGLSDDPRANAQLAAYLDAKASAPTILAPLHMTANHTLDQTDNGRTFYSTATAARSVNIAAGALSTDFHFYIVVLAPGTSTIGVNNLAGVPAIITDGMDGTSPKLTVSRIGVIVEVRCNGTQDQFGVVGNPYLGDNGPVQITGDKTFVAADDGQAFEAMGAYNLTFPIGLRWKRGISIQLPSSGTDTFKSTGGTLLNGATGDITRDISTQRVVAVLPRTTVDSYDII